MLASCKSAHRHKTSDKLLQNLVHKAREDRAIRKATESSFTDGTRRVYSTMDEERSTGYCQATIRSVKNNDEISLQRIDV